MSWLIDPFAFGFFARALAAGVVVGAVCGALGVFIIVRRMSYIGMGLSQAVLGGVAVSQAIGLGVYPGAAAATGVAAGAIERIRRRTGLHADAAIGLVATSLFALGVAVISANRSRELNVTNLLFGNVLGVSDADLVLAAGTAVAFAVLLWLFYKPLVFTTYDPVVARAHGVNTSAVEVAFYLAIAAVVIVSLRVMGVLLIAAALIIPASTARLAGTTFRGVLGMSTSMGAISGVVGLYISYYADIASGPAIVLTNTLVFGAVYAITGILRLQPDHSRGDAALTSIRSTHTRVRTSALARQERHATGRLHREHLTAGLFPRLGARFLGHYHSTFASSPHAAAVVAYRDGEPVGFLVGTIRNTAHYRWVTRNAGLRLAVAGAVAMLVRPHVLWLFLRTRLPRYLHGLRRHLDRSPNATASAHVEPPVAVLTHVATAAHVRGSGVGRELVEAFLDEVKCGGAHEVRLITESDSPAGAFYERLGWDLVVARSAQDGSAVREYRTIVDSTTQ